MTMRDLHDNIATVVAVAPQTIAGANLQSGNIDLQGFNSAEIVVALGDIDELGGSPVGSAKVELKLEHADDDGTGNPGAFGNVTLAEVIGPASVTGGIVGSTTNDNAVRIEVGYLGDKRFIRATLVPTGLTNGGPVCALVLKGHPRHAPQ
ncbi:MAG: hypothetical protein ACE5GS_06685 [Kiloniellaceae bacterium]